MKILFQNFCYGSGHTGTLSDYLMRPHHLYIQAPLEPVAALGTLLREHKPDIVAVTEIDTGPSFRTKKHNPTDLFRAFGYHSVIAAQKYKPEGLLSRTPIYKTQSNAIFAHAEPHAHAFHYLAYGTKRLVIEVTLPGNIHLFLVHLSIRRPTRKKQLQALHDLVAPHTHAIVLGDFNTLTYPGDIVHFCEDAHLRSLNTSHEFTYPSTKPRRELDYILVAPSIRVKDFKVLTTHIADHLPLLLEI